MFSSLKSILLLVLATRIYTLLLHQPLPVHAPNATEKSIGLNETFEEFSNLTYRRVRCMQVHGENVPIDSCSAALAEISRNTERKTYVHRHYAPRPLPPDQVLTPIRYLSPDGECAIDVILAPGSSGDEASSDVIYHNAKIVMDTCVIMEGKGGVQLGFTPKDDLKIVVRGYTPVLECIPLGQDVPSYSSCEEVIRYLPSNPRMCDFTTNPNSRSREQATYLLPKDYSIGTSNPCHVVVNMPQDAPETKENWFDLWAAAVAVNTMCLQHGMQGRALYLGQNDQITVSHLYFFDPNIKEFTVAQTT